MSHETPTLEAAVRERTGSRYAQRLRKLGQLPAIVYGHGQDPVAVSVDETALVRHLLQGAHVMNLKIKGAAQTCLVKDLQFGYLGDNVIHADFTRVNLDEEVTVNVHLRYSGTPAEAEKPGAVLTHEMTELEVICKVNAIPEEIRVDQSDMETVLTVADIILPPGVRAVADPDTAIAHITYVQEDASGEEAEVEAEGAQPEVITEAKDDGDESKESSD